MGGERASCERGFKRGIRREMGWSEVGPTKTRLVTRKK